MSNEINYMSAEHLEQYLRTESPFLLIIDCRPFLIHTESHIIDAVNVHCPPILRRRTGGRLPLRTVIPDDNVREKLIAGHYFPVILYEDSPESPDSMAYVIAKCLHEEGNTKNVYVLQEGFQQFRQQYPRYCTKGVNSTNSGSTRNPGAGNLTWPLKSCHKACVTPRTPKNLQVDSGGPLSFGNDQEEPVQILPHLYLGSEYHASCKSMLQKLGVTALLNVSHTCPNLFEDCFEYKSIPVEDSGNEDISIWFNEAIDFIESVRQSDGKVLVHCHAGISRSATICMAYLMGTQRLRMEEAYEYVKSRRKIVSPNFNFMGQLLNYEAQIFAGNYFT